MIKQAIIPLAGLGTRLLPLTTVIPKELLPISGKPNIEYILDECIEAGVKKFILIISKKKIGIKKYFYSDKFYQKLLKKKFNKNINNHYLRLKRYRKMITFVYQNNPKGTGDAILKCKKLIKEKHFLMLLPDDIIINKNCSKELIEIYNKTKSSVIATKTVNRKSVSRWGILTPKNKKKKYFQIANVTEKPSIKNAKSNYAIIGRYILPKKIFSEIVNLKPGSGNEIHITDAIKCLILKKKENFYASIFSGKYLDCGTLSGYIKSGLDISRRK